MCNWIKAIAVYFLFFTLPTSGQTGDSLLPSTDTLRLKLVFAGDIMGHDEQITGAWVDSLKKYDYEPTFRYVKPYIEQADIAVANLEVTLAGPPYKGYPQFSSPDDLALAARDAGFDVFIQANNHALDRGSKGFMRTLMMLDSLKISHTGAFRDSLERARNYPLFVEKNGIRLAMLNYTYGTNGLVIEKPYIINRIDTAVIRKDLDRARQANPDYVIVTLHWGEEYQRAENATQQRLAAFIFKHGADIIIGSHPHVIQPIRNYSTDSTRLKMVVFSQGNYVSNQRAQYKDGGIMVELNLEKTADSTRLADFSYMPAWVYRKDKGTKSTFFIVPVSLWEKDSTLFDFTDADRSKIARFAKDTREMLGNVRENQFYRK
ncbi:MAG TPA: CapA family protein [Bacteroidales bacterium]|nr:CapA family protein [Bacteroidales bacterium]